MGLHYFIECLRRSCLTPFHSYRHLRSLIRVRSDRFVNNIPVMVWAPIDDREVLFLNQPFLELFRQALVRDIVLGRHDDSGRITSEPVYNTWTTRAAHSAKLPEVKP